METINFELSKKLNDLWFLDNIDTKYHLTVSWLWFRVKQWKPEYKEDIKTLTLEEVIEFLPPYTKLWKDSHWEYFIDNKNIPLSYMNNLFWKTPLEAIESMLEYLLENNLLNN